MHITQTLKRNRLTDECEGINYKAVVAQQKPRCSVVIFLNRMLIFKISISFHYREGIPLQYSKEGVWNSAVFIEVTDLIVSGFSALSMGRAYNFRCSCLSRLTQTHMRDVFPLRIFDIKVGFLPQNTALLVRPKVLQTVVLRFWWLMTHTWNTVLLFSVMFDLGSTVNNGTFLYLPWRKYQA